MSKRFTDGIGSWCRDGWNDADSLRDGNRTDLWYGGHDADSRCGGHDADPWHGGRSGLPPRSSGAVAATAFAKQTLIRWLSGKLRSKLSSVSGASPAYGRRRGNRRGTRRQAAPTTVQIAGVAIVFLFVLAGCQSTPTAPPDSNVEDPIAEIKVDKKTQNLFDEAVAALDAENYRDAEILLSELTDREPELSGPWMNLGSAYMAQGKIEEASQAFKKAIDANPDNCAAHNQLGVLARQSGDFLAAEANYLACVQRVPEFREAYLNLGILYELYLGKLPEALDAYRTYQSLLESPDGRVNGWVMDLERRLVARNES